MSAKTSQPSPPTQQPPHDKNKHQDIPPPNQNQKSPGSDSYAEIRRQQQDRPDDKQRI